MKFRPCIDIHNGQVKQIVGSSICDKGNKAIENYVSKQDASYYAQMYREKCLTGGHIIQLNSSDSEYYEETKKQTIQALAAYPQGMQVGGGITAENAQYFLDKGATHVIVTSYVFKDGKVNYRNLEKISKEIGREHLVLDLSCRRRESQYYIVTDRWQKFTEITVTDRLLEELSSYCDEFLIHAVDVEGKVSGIEIDLVGILGTWEGIPITYAGGISGVDDINKLAVCGRGRLDFTIGSALDIFGGTLEFGEIASEFG